MLTISRNLRNFACRKNPIIVPANPGSDRNTDKNMKLNEVRKSAVACVLLSSGFANVVNWKFFAVEDEAARFAEEEGGRVVDEDGLAEKFESMHCAKGRIPNQSSSGRFSETPDDADDDWQEQEWACEYAESAAEAFKNATVYEIEEETDEAPDTE